MLRSPGLPQQDLRACRLNPRRVPGDRSRFRKQRRGHRGRARPGNMCRPAAEIGIDQARDLAPLNVVEVERVLPARASSNWIVGSGIERIRAFWRSANLNAGVAGPSTASGSRAQRSWRLESGNSVRSTFSRSGPRRETRRTGGLRYRWPNMILPSPTLAIRPEAALTLSRLPFDIEFQDQSVVSHRGRVVEQSIQDELVGHEPAWPVKCRTMTRTLPGEQVAPPQRNTSHTSSSPSCPLSRCACRAG